MGAQTKCINAILKFLVFMIIINFRCTKSWNDQYCHWISTKSSISPKRGGGSCCLSLRIYIPTCLRICLNTWTIMRKIWGRKKRKNLSKKVRIACQMTLTSRQLTLTIPMAMRAKKLLFN